MVNHSAMHHLHVRKRIHEKHEKYPSPDSLKRFIDRTIIFIAVAGPLMTLPQVLKIWMYQDASGVSLITWIAYLIMAFFWLGYGIVYKSKPIIIGNITFLIMKFAVVVGAWRYG